jgi:hypothetical protein
MVSFGSIAKQKPDSRTTYPLLPDPQGRYAAIGARILERSIQVEALAGALEVDKAELKTLATPFYFTNASGKLDVPSSIGVTCSTGEVLITFQNRYGKLESEAPLLPILGDQTSRFFRQAFTLEINGDKLPAEQTQALLDELQALFAKFHASEALKVKEGIKPLPNFHTLAPHGAEPETEPRGGPAWVAGSSSRAGHISPSVNDSSVNRSVNTDSSNEWSRQCPFNCEAGCRGSVLR